MNIEILTDNLPLLASGLLNTLLLMLCALALGLFLALNLTLVDSYKIPFIQILLKAYLGFIRGTPLLVQFFLVYYGAAQFDWIRHCAAWTLLKQPFFCAVLTLSINTSAYSTVLFKEALAAIPKQEVEAGYALGLSRWQMLRNVLAGRALRAVLPAYSNEVVVILKSTTLASTITLMELMGVTQQLISDTYQVIPFMLIAGAIYGILTFIILIGFRLLEKRLSYTHSNFK